MIRPSRSSVGLFTLHRSSTIVPPPSRKSPAVLHPPPLHPVAPTIPTREHTNASFYVGASVESPWKFLHFSDRLQTQIKTKDRRTISQGHKNNKNFKVLLRYEQDQGSIDKKELGILNKDCTLLNHFQQEIRLPDKLNLGNGFQCRKMNNWAEFCKD